MAGWFRMGARSDVPGERVLARAEFDGGEVVVTDVALLVRLADGERRWPWEALATATWDDDARTLAVVPMGEREAVSVTIEEPGLVPETVRERLTASVVVTTHVALTGSAGVRVLGRRLPGRDDLLWQLRFDAGVDPSDPGVRAKAEQALAEVRASTGV